MISLTITEKGYAVTSDQIGPKWEDAETALECLTAALFARFEAGAPPVAVVAMDNFAANGDVLKRALTTIAEVWHGSGSVPEAFVSYVSSLAYPWTMIDKITPHPSEGVAEILSGEGFPHTQITKTKKGTFTAPFVNAEASQYLVMEDDFPNGRPPFETLGAKGVYLTDRETVRKVDHMKVCACLNPLHTVLGINGMLLGYPTIASCMRDEGLVALVRRAAAEALPAVAHPGIIDPQAFLEEVLTVRFPNPFIPDTPARIVTDCSQKIPVRFGHTLRALHERLRLQGNTAPLLFLEAIPLTIALWLRYRMGWDDAGKPLTLAPDPLVPEEIAALEGRALGTTVDLRPILSNEKQFGVNLYEGGLGEKIEGMFAKLTEGPGMVAYVLKRT
jgi:fructuronate reductase